MITVNYKIIKNIQFEKVQNNKINTKLKCPANNKCTIFSVTIEKIIIIINTVFARI